MGISNSGIESHMITVSSFYPPLLYSTTCLFSSLTMSWPTMNRDEIGKQGFYDSYNMEEPSYPQALHPPSMPSYDNWTWVESAKSTSPSPWNATSSSQAMPHLGGVLFDWDILSSTNAFDTVGTGFEILAYNPDLDHFLGPTATSLSPTCWASSGDSSTNSPGQARCEENAGSNEISHRTLPTQPRAGLQNTRNGMKKIRQYVFPHSLHTFSRQSNE